MVSDWKEDVLSNIAEVIDSRHKTPVYSDSGYPMVRVVDINGGALNLEGTKRVSDDIYEDFSRGRDPEVGDLVISRVGSYGVVSYVNSNEKFCLGQNTAFIIPKINSRFLYYQLISPFVKWQIEQFVVGAVQKTISLKSIRQFQIKLPPVTEQKAIAHILGSLDDKIELNRQMNETLEAMAQALFKSWFVDFDPVIDNALAAGNAIPDAFAKRAEQRKGIEKKDNADIQSLFPNEFEFTEEMGWIPKGWEAKCIKDIGRVVTGKTPPKKIDNAYSEDGTPFITPTDIDDLPFVVYTNRYLSEDGVKAVKNSRISAGSICVTCIGSQMGKTTISPFASVSNQQINSITDCNQFWRNYLFFNLRRRREEIFLLGSSGSTMPILNKSNFEAVPILCPSEKLLSSLDSHFQSTIDSILENTEQNKTLCKLRDTLLPQLMSGELRIPDAEVLVEEVL